MHGRHTLLPHRNNVTSSHNAIVHPRMLGEALKNEEYLLDTCSIKNSQLWRVEIKASCFHDISTAPSDHFIKRKVKKIIEYY